MSAAPIPQQRTHAPPLTRLRSLLPPGGCVSAGARGVFLSPAVLICCIRARVVPSSPSAPAMSHSPLLHAASTINGPRAVPTYSAPHAQQGMVPSSSFTRSSSSSSGSGVGGREHALPPHSDVSVVVGEGSTQLGAPLLGAALSPSAYVYGTATSLACAATLTNTILGAALIGLPSAMAGTHTRAHTPWHARYTQRRHSTQDGRGGGVKQG